MRYCFGETVTVHEAVGLDLPALLREAADLIEESGGVATIHNAYDVEHGNILTVYLHTS